MNKKVALLVLLFAVTFMVCRSKEDAEKNESWTEWAKEKISGAFNNNNEQVKAAQDAPNTGDDVSEKAIEAEDAAANAAKELSHDNTSGKGGTVSEKAMEADD